MHIRLSLRAKLIAFCLAIGVIPLLIIGVYSVGQASGSLSRQAFAQLEAVRDAKSAALAQLKDKWFAEVKLYASVKEVYNSIAMLRDQFMGKARPGVRSEVVAMGSAALPLHAGPGCLSQARSTARSRSGGRAPGRWLPGLACMTGR